MLSELLIVALLMVINGILAGAEIAVVSVRKTRIDQLVSEGRGGARSLRQLRNNPEAFLATVQIGITIVGTTAGAFGGHALAQHLEPHLAGLPFVGPRATQVSLLIVILVLSFLELVLGELVPKSLALRSADRFGLLISRPLYALSVLLKPAVWFFTASSNVILRLFGDRTTFTESRLSPGEVQQIVDEATETGSVDPKAGEIASRAIEFADLTAARVMVPRQRVVGIPKGANIGHIRQLVLEHGMTRMPVYEGIIDHVVGYVTLRDLMALLLENQLLALDDAIRPAFKVAETMRAVDLLTEMRARRVQLAIVVDDADVMTGIVTLEDLVEELVGEIASENDAITQSPILVEGPTSALVFGDVPTRDVNRQFDLELDEGPSWSTIAGLCLELAGRIPKVGETFETSEGVVLEIVAASPRQVRRVRLTWKVREPE